MSGERVMSPGKIIAGIAAFAVLVFFVFNSLQLGGVVGSGYSIARSPAGGMVETLLLIIPLAALGIMIAVLVTLNREQSFARSASAAVLILAVLAVAPMLVLLFRSSALRQYFGVADLTGLTWGLGFWCSLVAGLVAFAGGLIDLATGAPELAPQPAIPEPVTPVAPIPEPPTPVPPLIMDQGVAPPRPTELLQPPVGVLAWLVVKSPAQRQGVQWPLGTTTTMGRDGSSCEVVIDDETVSRRHATIKLQGKQFFIYDLGSRNKTKVNGVAVQKQMLYDKDLITLGGVVLLFMRV